MLYLQNYQKMEAGEDFFMKKEKMQQNQTELNNKTFKSSKKLWMRLKTVQITLETLRYQSNPAAVKWKKIKKHLCDFKIKYETFVDIWHSADSLDSLCTANPPSQQKSK